MYLCVCVHVSLCLCVLRHLPDQGTEHAPVKGSTLSRSHNGLTFILCALAVVVLNRRLHQKI